MRKYTQKQLRGLCDLAAQRITPTIPAGTLTTTARRFTFV